MLIVEIDIECQLYVDCEAQHSPSVSLITLVVLKT